MSPPSRSPISVVCPDLSTNCLGRALVLAELASADHPVQVVGPQLDERIWPPAQDSRIPLRARRVHHAGQYPAAARWLRRSLVGSQVIVSKPLPTSLGLVLAAGVARRQFLLDIDDWELGFRGGDPSLERRGLYLRRGLAQGLDPKRLNTYFAVWALDHLARSCPHRLASNAWLARRFTAPILPHVRDTDWLDPSAIDPQALRERFALDGRLWVGFIGTAAPHKGLDDLVDALARIAGGDAPGLFLAGLDDAKPHVARLKAKALAALGPDRVRLFGSFPKAELPSYVGAPDIICIPSRDELGSIGQLPAKVFDAMAMAKPVVATRVNDLEPILQGAGLLVTASDPRALADALEALCRSPEQRRFLGGVGRERAVREFSHHAGRKVLSELVSRLPVIEGRGE